MANEKKIDGASAAGGAAVVAVVAAAVMALSGKGGDMTADDIKREADKIRAEEARIASLVEVQDPGILAAIPKHDGKLLGCGPDVAEFGTPKDLGYRVSLYQCRWLGDDGAESVQWLDADDEAKAREALADSSTRPTVVRVDTSSKSKPDPHSRDMSIPVYGRAGGPVEAQR